MGSGPAPQKGRGSKGVGIALSWKAQVAWERAGRPWWADSDRVVSVRLLVQTGGHSSRPIGLLLISGYAPTSADTDADHATYFTALERALARAQLGDIVVAGVDANASIGCGSLGLCDGGI